MPALTKLRITSALQREMEDAITDARTNLIRNTPDPSDKVYLKIHAAIEAVTGDRPVVIEVSPEDVAELKSRAEYEVGANGVCDENIRCSSEFADRAYWLGRKRAYSALLRQIKQGGC